MGRQRKDPRLPCGLRERDGYYSYVNPVDGREYGLGRNKRDSIAQAIEANAALRKAPSLLDRITGADVTWAAWCDTYEELLAKRERSANTMRTHRSQLNRMRRSFKPDRAVKNISTREISEVLDAIEDEGKARAAQAFRSFLSNSFNRMIAKGIRADNPVKVTDKIEVKVKRSRLSLETFLRVYRQTEITWLRNAMALALVSAQDRDSCHHAKFSDFRDGHWWNQRSKTGARMMIPIDLRLEAFGMSLDDVMRQCRATCIVSKHLVHQTERAKGARLGTPMHVDMITRVFSSEIEKLGLDWGHRTAPTFHEIRSLAGRLYKEQGLDPQALFGHRDPRTTAVYTDGRGEWVKVCLT